MKTVTRSRRRGRPRTYPWDFWFAQPFFVARKGRDFYSRIDSFVSTVRNNASKRGIPIHIDLAANGRDVLVQKGSRGNG